MPDTVLALALFLGLFLALIAAIEVVGRRIGRRVFAQESARRPAGLGTVETVAFGLLGLLMAFTFSGAAERFERRRALIVEECNDIGTAWLRLELAPQPGQAKLRELFRRYTDARIATYRTFATSGLAAARDEHTRAAALQNEIWTEAVAASREVQPATMLLLPAINAMIDIAAVRLAATEMHPPWIIYFVLGGMALACAVLVGFEMGASEARSWPHVLVLAALLSFTLCVILDFEYPRMGIIRVDFDHLLAQVRAAMN